MIFGLLRRERADPATARVYAAIVAQSRQPALYTDLGVADSVDGRYDMLVLHMALVLRRLSAGGERAAAVGQELCDLMFRELDRSLREIGVGDMSVPKRIKGLAKMFYGRAEAYGAALDAADARALAGALSRNVDGGEGGPADADALAAYALACAGSLAAQDTEALLDRGPAFAVPPGGEGAP